MAIQFSCESCRQPIEVDDEAANLRACCPYCQAIVQVPASSDLAVSGFGAAARPDTALQTALPVPHRQGAPASVRSDADSIADKPEPLSATLGFMAFSTIIISMILFIVTIIATMYFLYPKIESGPVVDVSQMQELGEELYQTQPWIAIASTFSYFLGFTAIGLAVGSLYRRERPRWPAITVLSIVAGFFCLVIVSLLLFSAMA
ncbi:MAG: hypothetical protein H6819_07940 [Phycisphaerales bacterium]|nr:hypothetical protein [Phycisphaerales bacterium]MCB9854294.1 hypothetical protein [Phycisphaerales bacterium]MCB9863495.1 hypothetical protein [Phycisphaerales bacterium]